MFAAAVWLVPVALFACGEMTDTDAPSLDALVFQDLGTASVSDTGDYTGDLVVDVPEGATSVMAWCGEFGDFALGKVWFLTDPSGTQLYDSDAPGSSFRSDWMDDIATSLLPVTPTVPPTPGPWTYNWWIGAGNPGSVDCGAVIKTEPLTDSSAIVVNLVFVGLDGLDAASAPDHTGLQAALDRFESEWGSGGLVPSYTYSDFTGDVTKFAVVDVTDDDFSEFNDLLRTADPANARSVTFFLVQEIANASAGGATILGLSAGPPGAAAISQTSKSGLVVSAIDLDADPDSVAKIMSHEGGHFLGLYHTTEKDGSQFDLLGDSPECGPENDADGNGVMNSSECAGMGAENVMWWTLTSGDATLTSDQGNILRSNPAAG